MKKITECILYNVIILHYYMDPIFSGHQHSFQSNLLVFFACLNVNYLHLFLGLQIPRSLSHLQRGSLCFWLKWHSFLSLDLWILYLMFSCLSFLIGIGDSFLPKKTLLHSLSEVRFSILCFPLSWHLQHYIKV